MSKFNEVTFSGLPSKSAKIRYLASIGMSRSQIAKKLDIRYQHVRNVLVQATKKTEVDMMVEGDL